MIREVFSNIFQIRVKLPYSPLGHLNSYLIKSKNHNLLIDTGLNFPRTFQSLCEEILKAGVKVDTLTELLLTHFHVDHVGLIHRFRETSKDAKILIHRVEAELSKLMSTEFEGYKAGMENFLKTHGVPSSIAMNLQKFHPAFFTPQAYLELSETAFPLEDGQNLQIGDYNFKVLWTPGHSPGHVCLYEPSLKILISGDHLLPAITPHIAQFMEGMDPLTDYLNSLEKIEKLDVKVVLPAHEEIFTNYRERIRQIKNHHEQRLAEILDRLKSEGNLTAYVLASKIHWNVNYTSWDKFPSFQKYLALGETVAHLNLLEQKRLVKKTFCQRLDQTVYTYSIA